MTPPDIIEPTTRPAGEAPVCYHGLAGNGQSKGDDVETTGERGKGGRVMASAVSAAVSLVAVSADIAHGLPVAAALVVCALAWLLSTMWAKDARAAVAGTLDERTEDAEARNRELMRLGTELEEMPCKIGVDDARPAKGRVLLRERSLRIEAPGADPVDVVFREADIVGSGRLALEVHDGVYQCRLEMGSAHAATKIKDAFDKATGRVYDI